MNELNFDRWPAKGTPYAVDVRKVKAGSTVGIWCNSDDGEIDIQSHVIKSVSITSTGFTQIECENGSVGVWYEGEGFFVPKGYLTEDGRLADGALV